MIFNLGSINADYFYTLPHLPGPGETLVAQTLETGLGGKGANQSVAAALAGAAVSHIGSVGPDGDWAVQRLKGFGVDVEHIQQTDTPTAHAIVMVDTAADNQIVVFPGANDAQDVNAIKTALQAGTPSDWLILQNETSHQVDAVLLATKLGMNIAYSAAPFDVHAVEAVLPYVTLLIMNEIEASQFQDAVGKTINDIGVPQVVITKGRDGAEWCDNSKNRTVFVPAFEVEPVDTTGAGDTFAGYLAAGLSQGLPTEQSLHRASAAAALSTTKKGTADAIPDLKTVEAFILSQETNGAFVPQS